MREAAMKSTRRSHRGQDEVASTTVLYTLQALQRMVERFMVMWDGARHILYLQAILLILAPQANGVDTLRFPKIPDH